MGTRKTPALCKHTATESERVALAAEGPPCRSSPSRLLFDGRPAAVNLDFRTGAAAVWVSHNPFFFFLRALYLQTGVADEFNNRVQENDLTQLLLPVMKINKDDLD